ncbi:MAG: 1,4-alpha-glucan branching protein GlgB [Deltaproteobacteria bacterium]|nr:1,4-alpha-glucan branching protein GlgB [Deltaproteobacteria bacterium]
MSKSTSDFLFGDTDLHLFAEGTHARLYDKLGAHPAMKGKSTGTCFAVWAPNAARVGVVGDFNGWRDPHWLASHERSGIWSGFVPGVGPNALYKYRIESRFHGYQVDKCDPLAFACEMPPATSARVVDLDYAWDDGAWTKSARERQALGSPMSIYELHLGSWRRVPEEGNRSLTYRELAPLLASYVQQMGFTHVEIMPVAEHPFYGSWGYQVTGFFAPTARLGSPQDFMFLVDTLHQHGIGVLLDWTPAHFPTDEHGLVYFDGTHLYEHADPRQGIHPDWGSAIFNYGRNEVRSFLISNACFWLDRYHVDGLRVDAVASMLYLDYARRAGEWVPNRYGGRENVEAIDFLRVCNEAVYRHFPAAQTIAEESTAWPMVSRPTYVGGLGFGYKWDMGWMHDTLFYMQQNPVHRSYHHRSLTFRGLYASSENFVLPLSHDEVVHGKGSLVGKMHGDEWQRFANLRLLYCYQWAQPGKKLLFMGGEFGQWREWNHEGSLDWHLLGEGPYHCGVAHLVGELNRLYRQERSLYVGDAAPAGMSWIDANDANHSVLAFLRRSGSPEDDVLCVFNFTPVPRCNYRLGVDVEGYWQEILNSDAQAFGGSGQGNQGGVEAAPYPSHGRRFSVVLTLPPLAALFLRVTAPARP